MISVCIATYNGAKYLKEQIDSILPQLSVEDQLVVSDDNSTDATLEILRSYNDPRIEVFTNRSGRKGVVANFENCLSRAVGEYIFLCDQDDVWLDGKVEECVAKLQSCDLVLHDNSVWDGERIINSSFFTLRNVRRGYWNNLYKNGYIGCCMAFTSRVKEAVLPFPSHIAMHDLYIGLLAEKKFKVCHLPKVLLLYRRHQNNASDTAGKSSLSLLQQIKYRLVMLFKTF